MKYYDNSTAIGTENKRTKCSINKETGFQNMAIFQITNQTQKNYFIFIHNVLLKFH